MSKREVYAWMPGSPAGGFGAWGEGVSKREVYACDRCKADDIQRVPVHLTVGVQMGSVNGQEPLTRTPDLCPACAGLLIERALSHVPERAQADLYDWCMGRGTKMKGCNIAW